MIEAKLTSDDINIWRLSRAIMIKAELTSDDINILVNAMGEPKTWWMEAERIVWFWLTFDYIGSDSTRCTWTPWEVTHMWRLLESRYHGHWNRPEYELMTRLRRLVNVNMDHRGRAAGQDVQREFVSRKLHVMPGARI